MERKMLDLKLQDKIPRKRSRGRSSRRWQDEITRKEGPTWNRKATDRRQWKTLM